MKQYLLLLFILIAATATAKEYHVVSNGRSSYKIVISEDASESEKYAAQEMQDMIFQSTGAKLPISNRGRRGKRILIGYNSTTIKLLEVVTIPDKNDESYVCTNKGGDIIIAGGSQRGSMYGVFAFLEKEVGIRWYSPSYTHIPKQESISFENINYAESPSFALRSVYYKETFDSDYSVHNRLNCSFVLPWEKTLPDAHGNFIGYWGCHTFNQFIPVDKYFKKHPEYFSLVKGKRIDKDTQLCLSNPDVFNICLDTLRKFMRQHPEYLVYDLSQNDCKNPCQCEKCKAIVKQEGSESGPIIHFVNRIAEQIEKEFPGKYISTFAYQYSRKAPLKVKPRDNVIIRLGSFECCTIHDFTCKMNQPFLEDLQEWSKISKNLYVWDYVVAFSNYQAPFPNFFTFKPKMQSFLDNNVIGVFEQGAYNTLGGEFSTLRTYVLSKLLWNTAEEVDALVSDYCNDCYGAAGKYVIDYFLLLHDQVGHQHVGISPDLDIYLYTNAFVQKSLSLFDQARACVSGNELNRVELAALPIYYLYCTREPQKAKAAGYYDIVERVIERENISSIAEYGKYKSIDEFKTKVKRNEQITKPIAEQTTFQKIVLFMKRLFA